MKSNIQHLQIAPIQDYFGSNFITKKGNKILGLCPFNQALILHILRFQTNVDFVIKFKLKY